MVVRRHGVAEERVGMGEGCVEGVALGLRAGRGGAGVGMGGGEGVKEGGGGEWKGE